MTTCPSCDGKRTVTEYVRDVGYSGGKPYPKSSHEVARVYQCSHCNGRGTVDDLDALFRATADIQIAFSDCASES